MDKPAALVYIAQEPRSNMDLSSAHRYGRLEMVLDAKAMPSITPGPCLVAAERKLRAFRPDVDYLCFAGGDPVALALAMLALRGCGLKVISFLRWDRERDISGKRTAGGFYVPVHVPLY